MNIGQPVVVEGGERGIVRHVSVVQSWVFGRMTLIHYLTVEHEDGRRRLYPASQCRRLPSPFAEDNRQKPDNTEDSFGL